MADRFFSAANVDVVHEVRNLFGEILSGQPTPAFPPAPQPAPPPTPEGDPRIVLGFEPGDKLSKEIIKERKKALAALFHPDRPGGSTLAMKRVNEAADKLLCSL
jgi:hypothetical protein